MLKLIAELNFYIITQTNLTEYFDPSLKYIQLFYCYSKIVFIPL